MRYLTLILGLLIIFSCRTNNDGVRQDNSSQQVDTISIIEKSFNASNKVRNEYEGTLIKEKLGDSILSFRYFNNSILYSKYEFNIRNGNFELIHGMNMPDLKVVDTFLIDFNGEKLTLFKYEIISTAMDDDGCMIFNNKYGLIGQSAYSWHSRIILTNWDGLDVEEELISILLSDTVRYLRRQNPIPPPPSIEELEKTELMLGVVDTVEIELDE